MADSDRRNPVAPPPIVLHRLPAFKPSFLPPLDTKFTVLDPHEYDQNDPFFLTLSTSVRLMLCLGPSPISSHDLNRYPAVECIVASSAGVDHIDLTACRRRGIRVTSAGEAFSDDVADYAVGLVIDVLRRISAADRFVRSGSWKIGKDYALTSKLSGKRVGIVGLGSIGLRVAKRLKAFGCSIAYKSRNMNPHVLYPYHATTLDLALSSDILIVCCALTDETRHLVNKDVLRALGKTGVVINVGRGALIDEKELVECLVRGDVGGAGLDVFEHEPRVPEELLELDNVVLSPHRAVLTPESFAALGKLVMSNLQSFFLGEPLRAEIKLE